MNIKQLISFVTVANRRSLSQAATILNYSQSTIYEHLNNLEEELNTNLYNRTSRGIELSEKGQKFLPYAMQMIELYNESVRMISDQNKEFIRIGASATSDVCLMDHLINEYVNQYQYVDMEYSKMTTDVALSKTIAGSCDIALICELDFHSNDVNTKYLCTLPCIFVASPINEAAKHGLHKDKDGLPMLLGTMQLDVAFKMLESVGLEFDEYFSSLRNIGDLELVKQLTAYNKGVSLLPKVFVQKDIDKGVLARIPNLMQEVQMKVFILTSNKRSPRLSVANMIKLLNKLYGA